MAMNKYMHPRNIYKSPPNFKQLALEFPEFREFATQDITGKVSLDFKNIKALRALSCILLKKDFNLNVEIPLDKLIPTIPLRLNYILWLEDLLELTTKSEEIKGLDIGTGASCVYPLLAAKKNKWHMLASEVDDTSITYAKNNVKNNNLEDFIQIIKVDEHSILKDVVKEEYNFCMCNPPFFGSTQELNSSLNTRSLNRPKPKNSFCASTVEVVVKGGEVDFLNKLIHESKILGTQIKIYTTMVGHKKSLPLLKKILREVEVCSFKETEFCQGNTTRWGLAWTFCSTFDLKKCLDPVKLVAKKDKPKDPLTYKLSLGQTDESSLNLGRDLILKLLDDLQMVTEEVSRKKNVLRYFVSAYSNTWSNQRRKRRTKLKSTDDRITSIGENNNLAEKVVASEETIDAEAKSPGKRSHEDNIEGVFVKKLKIDGEETIFFKFLITLRLEECDIILELDCLIDSNRDYLHQILQYIKNNLKT